ncbi:DinB family protein [Ktedonosporobacter rubrisoli]|uniref:DinB family protein n=1 Tax=Ktedonosporobacter rubrisoli TaxID=2509675 RepID=A0A4P6JL19_KTERU|nr:DinB family protein [Ktedonosporobacter rubrisoli]QBD75356.1 DinB family protein [Ktedonosporobacter rubrisoli]
MSLPARLAPFLKQFDYGRERLITRLHDLSDDEYLWEPMPGCWSIHPREQSQASTPFGRGDWVMDFAQPEPVPPPVTTIAWRMCHLTNGFLHRADYVVGTASLAWDDYAIAPTAQAAIASLNDAALKWRSALSSATETALDQIGYSKYPWGLDRRLPFLEIVWWVNQELLSHGAEIALLRDLYRANLKNEGEE